MEIEDIKAGRSYACYITVAELVDKEGEPLENATEGDAYAVRQREVFGVIKTRDTEKQLVEVIDTDTGKSYTVGWEDCRDIDEVEWRDPD